MERLEKIFKRFYGVPFVQLDPRQFRPLGDEGDSSGLEEPHHHGNDQSDNWNRWHLQQKTVMEEIQMDLKEALEFFIVLNSKPSGSGESESKCKPDLGSTARDQMLKEEKRSSHPVPAPEEPSHSFSGFPYSPVSEEFTGTPRADQIPPKERKDHDINSERPDEDEIVGLYRLPGDPRDPFGYYRRSGDPFGNFFNIGSSMNMQTVIGADGVIEEQSTMKDSSGREETTVTRRMGDKCHTVTTIKDENGQEEIRETFQNIDKDKMSEFEQQWRGKGHPVEPATTDPGRAVLLPSLPGGTLSDNRGFFRKLFGF